MQAKMMAVKLHALGDLRLEQVDMPVCGEDEVLLAVRYCGICGSDVPRIFSKGAYHYPLIPGHEFSGVVAHDPKGELTGRRVAVFPMLPCFRCDMCKGGRYELCRSYSYYGSRCDGGFAEYVAVKRWNVLQISDNVSLRDAAMCEPASVAHHAVSNLQIKRHNSALVSGAGPIGLIVAQWMKIFGAEQVYLFDISKGKMEFAKQMGFLEYEDGIVVDAALEGTGCADALMRCLDSVKPSGRLVLMGNPSGSVTLTQQAYWQILRKELQVSGTWNSSFKTAGDDWTASMEAIAAGKLELAGLISHERPLSQWQEAFSLLKDRSVFTNRVMFRIGE